MFAICSKTPTTQVQSIITTFNFESMKQIRLFRSNMQIVILKTNSHIKYAGSYSKIIVGNKQAT